MTNSYESSEETVLILTDASFGFYFSRQLLIKEGKKACFITCSKQLLEKSKLDNNIQTSFFFDKQRNLKRYNPKASRYYINLLSIILSEKTSLKQVFCHEIYSLHWNVMVQFIKQQRPDIDFFLIVDGTFNMFYKPLTLKHSLNQLILSCIHPFYHKYKGDWYGVDAKQQKSFVAKSIYLPLGMPNEYSKNRVKYFDVNNEVKENKSDSKKALIIEQSLVDRGYINANKQKMIIDLIKSDLNLRNIKNIYVVKHPKAKKRDFYSTEFMDLNYNELSLEEHILNNSYESIYSSFSTVFLLSQCKQDCDFISVGIDSMSNIQNKKKYIKNFKLIGVSFIG